MTRRVVVHVEPTAAFLHCRSCGARIRWGKTNSGRACPADAMPIDGKHYSHFETCPNAPQHRKAKR